VTKTANRDKLTAAFRRSEWWRYAMIGFLLALIVAVALLSTGIGHPVRDVVNFVAGVLVLGFSVSFVVAAFTSLSFRRVANAAKRRRPPQPKAPMTTHDRIVYVIAFVLATALGLAFISSFGPAPWVWPAFVIISLVIVGIVLLIRR
jgi:MFS family permease